MRWPSKMVLSLLVAVAKLWNARGKARLFPMFWMSLSDVSSWLYAD